MDTLSREERSERMSRVRGRDTKPELIVRKALHARGYRYRLHDKRLPGRPDIVFPARRKAVLVNGCFWHMHEGCALARMPKSRLDFWRGKLEANRARDVIKLEQLRELGWDVEIVWECQIRDMDVVMERLENFLKKD
jgi:DNA mismatch endonuclease, patch repair protein